MVSIISKNCLILQSLDNLNTVAAISLLHISLYTSGKAELRTSLHKRSSLRGRHNVLSLTVYGYYCLQYRRQMTVSNITAQ